MVLRCSPSARVSLECFLINVKEILEFMVLIFLGFLVLDFFPNVKKPGLRMVYLKMVTGAPV